MSKASLNLKEVDSVQQDNEYGNFDYVLVYDFTSDITKEVNHVKRRMFERNLIKTGVKLSKSDGIIDRSLCFVKLRIPWNVLLTFADIMKIKMPLKTNEKTDSNKPLKRFIPGMLAQPKISRYTEKHEYWSAFRYDKKDIFNIEPQEEFFTKSQKSLIAYEILLRTKYGDGSDDVGINRLLQFGIYISAYPLHEGRFRTIAGQQELTERQILYESWVRPKRFYQIQPVSLIRKYFGEKIAIYFSWLGFYTLLLIPISFIGLIGFMYNILNFGNNTPSIEICNETGVGSIVMCPLCDRECDYWRLSQSCIFSKITGVFDNTFTIAFAILMSLWGTIFLQLWKRKQTDLQYSWHTDDYEESENLRLEYEIECKNKKVNPVTGELEWYMTLKEKLPRKLASVIIVFLMLCVVVLVIVGIIITRIILTAIFAKTKYTSTGSYMTLVIAGVTSIMDLCAIIILNVIYDRIAVWLTDLENPRTETEYESTLTLKMYIFQFFNFYSSLFYFAFLKGAFVGRPGKYLYFSGWRLEICDPSGCLLEVSIQMIVIFVGKQILNNVMEISYPFLKGKWFLFLYRYKHRHMSRSIFKRDESNTVSDSNISDEETGYTIDENINRKVAQWEKDFRLMDSTCLDLFEEYLEMVIQYGFILLFAATMPLAPLFALINNIIEIRIDAFKMLTKWKRPLAKQAQDIGIWNDILRVISIIGVVTNGFIISYSSNAIPRVVYEMYYNQNTSNLLGYVNFTLSYFNVKHFDPDKMPIHSRDEFRNVTVCRFRGYRNYIESENSYPLSSIFWHILAARLAFVIVFEHVVFYFSLLIEWMIPPVSQTIKIRIEQEKLLKKNLMYQAGTDELQKVLFEAGLPKNQRSTSELPTSTSYISTQPSDM